MANFDQKVGVQIIRAALKVPVRTIAGNAGVEGSVVVEKVLASNEQNWGYDAATGEYGCMIKAGVIDPLKVVRTALVDAASVSSLMMTSECMITEGPRTRPRPPPPTWAAAWAAAWAAWEAWASEIPRLG